MAKQHVSNSQVSIYSQCPHRWNLEYIQKIGEYETNIYLIFGTSMHTVIQKYLLTLYNESVKNANEMDLDQMLIDEMKSEFAKSLEKGDPNPCTKAEMIEFYYDGIKIFRYMVSHQKEFFPKRKHKLLGIESNLDLPYGPVNFVGYLDVVILNEKTQKIKIIDLKTSTNGWNKWQKMDKIKTNQLLFYKKFYGEKYNVKINDIQIEYLILKRKLYENIDYPQKRIQRFVPANGVPSVNKAMAELDALVTEGFTEDGEYNTDRKYQARSGKNNRNCTYCPFKDHPEYCEPKSRMKG
jgi:hypothetical protein